MKNQSREESAKVFGINKPLNITQGKAIITQNRTNIAGVASTVLLGLNCKIHLSSPSTEQAQSNAKFIAEAFNVANETGLSPKMMQEQNEALQQALKSVIAILNDDVVYVDSETKEEILKANRLLQSIQKGGANEAV